MDGQIDNGDCEQSIDGDDSTRQADLDDLETRIEELESKIQEIKDQGDPVQRIDTALVYLIGSSLAMVLSWSRNASILWGILHGFLSWAYVIYFGFTR
jgi:hypothetical protein